VGSLAAAAILALLLAVNLLQIVALLARREAEHHSASTVGVV
jgi:hypothetical protein